MRTLLSLALVAALTTPAFAQTPRCAERDLITSKLSSGYGEKFMGGGLRNEESVLEIWMSDENGTWTILMTNADGRSCVMAAGTNWRDALPEKAAGIPG